MRKTTDPKERKYLTDREFNTFGRGAIEDAPAELLYGKGALAQGFNVNCYNSYFEGRTGSECVNAGRDRTPVVVEPRQFKKTGKSVTSLEYLPDSNSWFSEDAMPVYLDWVGNDEGVGAAGYRDVVTNDPRSGNTFLVESDAPRHSRNGSGLAVLRDKPMLLAWHDTLNCYVRVEGGRFYVMWDKDWVEVFAPERHTCKLTLGRERCTFIPGKTGGFLYTKEGIYRWISDENVIVKINRGAPLVMESWYDVVLGDVKLDHVYRYEFTGLRLRGKGRIEDPVNTIVDFETPVSEHNFGPYQEAIEAENDDNSAPLPDAASTGVWTRGDGSAGDGSISRGRPAALGGFDWEVAANVGAMTHIGVYRTLDTVVVDLEESNAWGKTIYNSPNLLGLVADVPMATVFLGILSGLEGAPVSVINPEGGITPYGNWDLSTAFVMLPYNRHDIPGSIQSNDTLPIWRCVGVSADNKPAFREVAPGAAFEAFPNLFGQTFLFYTSHSDCAFAVTVESGNTVRWSGGMDINDGPEPLVGKAIFLSDGEAYTVLSQSDGECDNDGPNRPLLTLTRPISSNPSTGTRYGAVVVTVGREVIADAVDDDVLRPRRTDWYPRTRFCRALPNCNVAAAVPGFVLCAIEGESTLRYTADDGMGGYTHGSHNPIQINEQVAGGITQLTAFPDVCAVMTASATWAVVLGVSDYYKEPGSGWVVPIIPKINIVDNRIGCAFPRTVQYVSGGEIIMFTRIGGEAAVVLFNGHQYGENMLVDTALGLSRNQNRARDAALAVAIYGESTGYIVWMTMGEDERGGDLAKTISSYCFRLAVRSTQGGGVTEYGGEGWLWPDADAGVAVTGRDDAGAAIVLVEDARTGFLFRIGVAEQWLDKMGLNAAEWGQDPVFGEMFVKYPEVGGYEIETRVALPIISDGYKWQKHLETHIAMRCWKSEYRRAEGFTKDGFKPRHKAGLKIYEDGEQIAEESALQDLNRNGDYAYLKKIDARRIQEVIETTTSAYKISQVIAKVQTSDREALPVNNEPIEVRHQREWRLAVIHLSRNLPCPTYNRADGTEMGVVGAEWHEGDKPREVGRAVAPTGKPGEAFWVATGLHKTLEDDVVDFTVSMWIRPDFDGDAIKLSGSAGEGRFAHRINLALTANGNYIRCTFDGAELLRYQLKRLAWQQVALRRKVNGPAEMISLFVDGENVMNAMFGRTTQGVMGSVDFDVAYEEFLEGTRDQGTFDVEPSFQNTWSDVGEDIYAGRDVCVGQGKNAEYFDVRLMLSAVSGASVYTYYHAVRRGGEGWLP